MSDSSPALSIFPAVDTGTEDIQPVQWMEASAAVPEPLFSEPEPGEPSAQESREARQAAARDQLSETPAEHPGPIPAPAVPADPHLPTPPPGAGSVVPESMLPPADLTSQAAETEVLRHELDAAKQAFAQAAAELATARARTILDAEETLVELAVDIAGAVLEQALDVEDHHRTLARAAISALGEAEEVILRTSTEGYEVLRDVYGEDKLAVGSTRVTLRSDPSLTGLGCIAESPDATVDGRIDARLQNVRRALADEVRRRRAEVEG
ncbi:MAG: FliH/SctL family protein [Myxococcota bacterium]